MHDHAPTGATVAPVPAGPAWRAYVAPIALAAAAAVALWCALLTAGAGESARAARLEAAAAIGGEAAAALQATDAAVVRTLAAAEAPPDLPESEEAPPSTEPVWGHLDEADRDLALLLLGDAAGEPPLSPVTGAAASQAGRVRALLVNVRYLAEMRLLDPEAAEPSSDLGRRHAAQTALLLGEAETLRDQVAELAARGRAGTRRLAMALFALGNVLLAAAAIVAVRTARRRRSDTPEPPAAAPGAPAPPAPPTEGERPADLQTELLAAALAQAGEIVFLADRKSRILFVNDAFVERLGWSREEVVGHYAEVLRSDRHDEAFYLELDRVLQEGRTWRGTLFLGCKGGGALEVEQAITPIRGPKDRVTNHLVVARDATRDRALTARLAHVQRLEGLGVLGGGIAHDLNNILTSILGHAALARNAEGGAAEALERIETAARRASELCGQMLAYAGLGRVERAMLDLSATVREMSRLLEVSLRPGVDLVLELADGLPSVEGDPGAIRQVVMNLVVNAAEAVGAGPGTVTVRTGTVRASKRDLRRAFDGAELTPGEFVFLEVADTGAGMPPSVRRRMFEPFFTTKTEGRGLGMSAVRRIVREHMGALDVKSAVGQGSTFRLLLPPAGRPMPPLPPEPPADREAWRGSGTVLVVDDEQSVRLVACRMLESLGFAVEAATDGAEALAAFREHPGDYVCVLLDLTLPGMDGAETFRHLREVRADVPVVVISGYGVDEAAARIADAGVSGFLAKPFTPEQLRGRLRDVLREAAPAPDGDGPGASASTPR